METFASVIRLIASMLDTPLRFNPFSFTIGQAFIGLAALSICVFFVKKLFD